MDPYECRRHSSHVSGSHRITGGGVITFFHGGRQGEAGRERKEEVEKKWGRVKKREWGRANEERRKNNEQGGRMIRNRRTEEADKGMEKKKMKKWNNRKA